jgi:hypothetical protein
LLKISKDFLREWIVEIIWNDKGARSETEWPRTTYALDGSNLRDRLIMLGDDQRLALKDAMKHCVRILFDFFNRDIHVKDKCSKRLFKRDRATLTTQCAP